MKYAKLVAYALVVVLTLGSILTGYHLPDEGMFIAMFFWAAVGVAIGLFIVLALKLDPLAEGEELLGPLLLFIGLLGPEAGQLIRHTGSDVTSGFAVLAVAIAMAAAVCEQIYHKGTGRKALSAI